MNENKANRFNYAKSQGIYENKYVQLRQKHGDFKEKSVEVRGYFIVISFLVTIGILWRGGRQLSVEIVHFAAFRTAPKIQRCSERKGIKNNGSVLS